MTSRYLPWVNEFFDFFMATPLGCLKRGARTLAIPKTAVKKFKIDNTNKPYSGARKNTVKKNKKQCFTPKIVQIKYR